MRTVSRHHPWVQGEWDDVDALASHQRLMPCCLFNTLLSSGTMIAILSVPDEDDGPGPGCASYLTARWEHEHYADSRKDKGKS